MVAGVIVLEAEMGVVLQFQSFPRGRTSPSPLIAAGKSDGQAKTGKVIIFPGIRIDRNMDHTPGSGAPRRKTGKGPAE